MGKAEVVARILREYGYNTRAIWAMLRKLDIDTSQSYIRRVAPTHDGAYNAKILDKADIELLLENYYLKQADLLLMQVDDENATSSTYIVEGKDSEGAYQTQDDPDDMWVEDTNRTSDYLPLAEGYSFWKPDSHHSAFYRYIDYERRTNKEWGSGPTDS